ncbi:unnamed protein product [Candidula unifasciata]|uniref:Uncharacterized protein n=1 Tax=Candidula unifasciata TaxID=100452 RepID=A0A8S3YM25_9EUPU|nr:unnamed protein product [Candidula unifasciata]
MAARKKVPNKPKTFIGQHLNGTSDSKCNSKLPRTSTAILITSDVTTYLKLSVLILLVAGVVGFLLYPDILNVLRTVQGNAGFNEQTRKQELQTEKLRVIERNNVEDDDKLSPSDEDDAKVILADETDHENVSPLENTKKRKFKEEEMINQKNSLEPGESVAAFDEDDSDLVVYDSIGHEDLMEDEEKETQLKMLKSSLNLNPEAKQGATKLEDTTMSQAESLNKETRNQQPKDKMSSADEKIREGRPGKSLDKTGKKSGPIILNAQNSHVVLDPSQIKIINSSLDKKPETKQQSHSKKHQDAPKTQTNQNKTRKSNAKIKAEKPTKVNAEANEENETIKEIGYQNVQ